MSDPAASPNYRTGKICYLEIPSNDIAESARFYQQVFGWHVRQRPDGSTAFDDTTHEVSGSWIVGRPPATSGIQVHIMVADITKAIAAIISAGGAIVQPVNPEASEVYALFADPTGNVLGVYQQPGLAETEARLAASQSPDE